MSKKIDFIGNVDKIKFSNYMKNMRMEADPFLYKENKKSKGKKWSYNTSCPNQQMRQPYIVTKDEISNFDKDSLTGYMKYRNNYYICPRIWDYQVRKPIAIKDFIGNNFKSPYSDGSYLNPDLRNKQELSSKNSVIIRKPSSEVNSYWGNYKLENEWPEILKGTENEAFPGLIYGKNHPQNLCYPCCFKNKPKDYKNNSVKIQNFQKPYGTYSSTKNCKIDEEISESVKMSKKESILEETGQCNNKNYIISNNVILQKCRFGLLPEYLDILLNNNQEVFLNSKQNSLVPLSNIFLKKGVKFNNKIGNFLENICLIKNLNIKLLKQIIHKSLTPIKFISLNQGDLVSIYSSNELLPNSENKYKSFYKFLKINYKLGDLFDIKLTDLKKFNQEDYKKLNDINYIKKFKKIIILYKIYTSYTNFIKNLYNDIESIDYNHLLDFISRPNENLFKYGVNILIFNNRNKNLLCNPYFINTNDCIILIKENENNFTPIFHIRVNKLGKISGNYGTFRIDKYINIDDNLMNFLVKKNISSDIIEDLLNRSVMIKTLLKIHNSKCVNNHIYNYYSILKNKITSTFIKSQIISNSSKIQYLLLNSRYLLPIIPSYINKDIKVSFLDDIINNLPKNSYKTWIYYDKLNNELKNDLKYKPEKFVIYKNDVIGILFENGLITPIRKEPISKDIEHIPMISKKLYYDEFIPFYNEEEVNKKNITKLLFQDYLYQQFKYDFSNYINEYDNLKYKKSIEKIFNKLNIFSEINKFNLKNIIFEVMNNLINDSSNEILKLEKKLYKSVCYKLKENKCEKSILCKYNKKQNRCMLNIDSKILDFFSNQLSNDLINNILDRHNIIKGIYIPSPYLSQGFMNTEYEFILQTDIDTNPSDILKEYLISKFKKNIKKDLLDEYQIILLKKDEAKDYISRNKKKSKTSSSEFKNKLKKLSNNITDFIFDYIYEDKDIYATIFDKDGKININMGANKCQFPFLDKNTKKLEYNCIPVSDKDEQLMCPIKVNEFKKPIKWGYCPENPKITAKKFNLKEVNTYEDKNKGFYSGKCKFPFLNKYKNKLLYECEKIDKDNQVYSECPISFEKNIKDINLIPFATTSSKNIWNNRWKFEQIYKDNKNKFNRNLLKSNKKGYCKKPFDKNNKFYKIIQENKNKISITTYKDKRCLKAISKNGYSKNELFSFAVDKLNIPYEKLIRLNIKDEEVIAEKEELCKVINNYFKKIKMIDEEDITLKIRQFRLCKQSESKGGIPIKDLRNFVIKRFKLDYKKIKNLDRHDICKLIKKIDKDYFMDNSVEENTSSGRKTKKLYNKDIKKCHLTEKNGGYKLKDLKSIAKKNFNLNVENLTKKKICKLIEKRLIQYKKYTIKKLKSKSKKKKKLFSF